ncbi:MAG: tetratricopeptide repeat protein [Planctomycetota bacterium]
MTRTARLIVLTAAMAAAASLSGCKVLNKGDSGPNPDTYADVTVIDPYTDEEITVRAFRSGNQPVRDAIKHLQNEDFDEALAALELAVAESPRDDRAWFALGLCREWLEDYEGAVEAYKQANFIDSQVEYQQARVRAEGWL